MRSRRHFLTSGARRAEPMSWRIARAGWAACLAADLLQSRIHHKAARLSYYKNAIAENYLVIVAAPEKDVRNVPPEARF
jgi:hypothetical protein